jgi:hypothetical protein
MTDFYDIFGGDDVPVFDRGRTHKRTNQEDHDVVSLIGRTLNATSDKYTDENRTVRDGRGSPTSRLSRRRPGRF